MACKIGEACWSGSEQDETFSTIHRVYMDIGLFLPACQCLMDSLMIHGSIPCLNLFKISRKTSPFLCNPSVILVGNMHMVGHVDHIHTHGALLLRLLRHLVLHRYAIQVTENLRWYHPDVATILQCYWINSCFVMLQNFKHWKIEDNMLLFSFRERSSSCPSGINGETFRTMSSLTRSYTMAA